MKNPHGFTLIEMMVAVSIFAIAMLVGVGALLSLIEANRRAQSINSVMQNVSAAVDGMSRALRVGTDYHCEDSTTPIFDITSSRDCNDPGGILLAFESSGGSSSVSSDQIIYRFVSTAPKRLERSTDGGSTWIALTAPEVSIESARFYVIGSTSGDTTQPRVLIIISGTAGIPGGTTSFTVQSSVTQRVIDL